jgi:hypothetical protein
MRKLFPSYLIIVALFSIILIQSCKKQDNTTETYVTDEKFVAISEARDVAEKIDYNDFFGDSIKKSTLKSASTLDKRVIKDSLAVCDKNNKQNCYFYVFNYKAGGFCIVSADKRNTPVIAFSDQGSFNIKLESISVGLAQWMEGSAAIIKNKRNQKLKSSSSIDEQWERAENPSITNISTLKMEPITPPQRSYVYTVGPLLKTTWDQGCGYNDYCPNMSNPNNCDHAFTGCATTAIAQVLAYWKFPSTYNWSAMSLTYGNDYVARLMGDIFPNVISSYNEKTGSACTNDYNITHVLLNTFHFRSASLAGYVNGITENGGMDDTKIIQNVISNQPVIIGGMESSWSILGIPVTNGGHVWVVDGYKYCYAAGHDGMGGIGKIYYGINWGWSGTYNGWFSMDSWSTPNGNYNCYNDMIFNIYP